MFHPPDDHGEGGIGSPRSSAGQAVRSNGSERLPTGFNYPKLHDSEAGSDIGGMVRVPSMPESARSGTLSVGMGRVPSQPSQPSETHTHSRSRLDPGELSQRAGSKNSCMSSAVPDNRQSRHSERSVMSNIRWSKMSSKSARSLLFGHVATSDGTDLIPRRSSVVGDVSIRKEILRGTKVSKALGRLGALWRTAPDELPPDARRALWHKSEECDVVDAFISHAWSTPWWQRYLTLMIYFYWRPACVTTLAVGILAFILDLADALPTIYAAPQIMWDMKVDMVCWYPVPALAGLLVLFLCPTISQLRRHEPKVFLDVVCINQAEEELKVEGVQSFGGFLNKSRSMIVLWAPQNLSRAWCVFELATFIALHGDHNLVWCPIFLYSISFIVFIGVTLVSMFIMANSMLGLLWMIPRWALLLIFMGQGAVFAIVFHKGRAFMRERHHLAETLAGFTITGSQCRRKSDRRYILDSVRHWYGDESSFNEYVRGTLAKRMLKSTAAADANYLVVLGVTSPSMFFSLATARGFFRSGLPVDQKIAVALNMVNLGFFITPLWLKLLWLLTDLFRDKFTKKVVNIGCSVVVALAWFLLGNAFMFGAAQSSLQLAVGYVVGCALTCWLLFVVVPTCMARRKARVRPAELEGDHDKAGEETGAGTAGCLPEEPKHRDPPRK